MSGLEISALVRRRSFEMSEVRASRSSPLASAALPSVRSDTWPGRQLLALHRSLMGTLCHCVSDPCVFGLGEAWAGLVHREGWCRVSHWWRYRLGRGQERVVGILGEGGVTVASSRKSTFCSFGLGGQQSQCPETITIQAPQRRVSEGQDTLALAASIF